MMRFVMQAGLLSVALGMLLATSAVEACPFCSAPSLTLSEQLDQADVVALVKWREGQAPKEQDPGFTVYEIVELSQKGKSQLKVGEEVQLVRYRAAKSGDLFLLLGTLGQTLEWSSPMEVTKDSYAYLQGLPAPTEPTAKRLSYFLKYLEHSDVMVSNDAYGEFANAPYKDIKSLKASFPRESLRKWLSSTETPVTRIGLYGLLLGLCGNEDDGTMMAAKISDTSSDDFRLGIDGVMSGYLLISGDEGLALLEDTKLKPAYLTDGNGVVLLDSKGKQRPVPFSETYAAMQALRFMWTYGDGQISKDRLRQSMRLLLDRPELADLVIADLARWKDWSVQDRLMSLYAEEEFDIPSIKRAIVRYLYYCSKDLPEGVEEVPEYILQARAHLADLEKRDPKTVREARRFLLP